MHTTTVRRTPLLTAISTVIFAVSACSPTKGYPGPDLPEERVSLIEYDAHDSAVSIDRGNVDGVSFGSSGIAVLPGSHHYELSLDITGEKGPCRAYADLDESGYHDCRKKDKYCDCHSYVTVREKCDLEKRYGTCRGRIETLMGRKYTVGVDGGWNGASSRVSEVKGPPSARSEECSLADPRQEETDDYVGSGSSYVYKLDSPYDDPCYYR